MLNWIVLLVLAATYLAGGPTSAIAEDRDNDGLPDKWERKYHISTSKKSAKKDPDHDGLRNRREYRERTHPRRADTDRDGYDDRAELNAGSNPRNAASRPYPNRATTGVPTGWTPEQVQSTDLTVRNEGAVVEDVLLTDGASLEIEAPNVTVRRVKLEGGSINNYAGSECANGLLIADTTIEPLAGQDFSNETEGVVSYGGYTARGVEIWHRSEGFRISSKGDCGPVRIEDSFAVVTPPRPCGDWHGDGLQGYDGDALTVRNVTLELDITDCGGTAPFFYPSGQGNTSVDIDGLLVKGGGVPFRLGTPGSVRNLRIANNSWAFDPVDVNCDALSHWDAHVVNVDANYQVTGTVRAQRCDGEGT